MRPSDHIHHITQKEINDIKIDLAKSAISSLCLNNSLNTLEISDQAVSIANNVYGLIYGKDTKPSVSGKDILEIMERQKNNIQKA